MGAITKRVRREDFDAFKAEQAAKCHQDADGRWSLIFDFKGKGYMNLSDYGTQHEFFRLTVTVAQELEESNELFQWIKNYDEKEN